MPQWERAVSQAIATKKFPYKTPSDVWRHAMRRHLRWLNEQDEELRSVYMAQLLIMDLCQTAEESRMFGLVFDALRQNVTAYLNSGYRTEALRLIVTAEETLQAMPDGEMKERHLERFEQEYSGLLKEAKPLSFLELGGKVKKRRK